MAAIKASARHPSLKLLEPTEDGLIARARPLRPDERNPLV
jgi:hypothetical protein